MAALTVTALRTRLMEIEPLTVTALRARLMEIERDMLDVGYDPENWEIDLIVDGQEIMGGANLSTFVIDGDGVIHIDTGGGL